MYRERNSFRLLKWLDFTSLPTQNLTPNGNYVVDGVQWTSENTAVSSVCGITNGTGLVMTANAGGSLYGDNVRSSVLVRTNLSNYVPEIALGKQRSLRFWFRMLLSGADTNFEFGKCGIERATTPEQFHAVVGRGFNTGNIIVEGQISTSAVSSRANVTSSDEIIGLTWKPHWNFDFFRGGNWTGEFPFYQEPTNVTSLTSSLGSNYLRDIGDPVAADIHPRIVFTAQPTGSANTFTATWTHMAILQLAA